MTLTKQLDTWYQIGDHQAAVDAILSMKGSEITEALAEDLAVAYNNLGQYQDAITALKAADRPDRRTPHWYYCMGYALYYTAMDCPSRPKRYALLQGALDSFTQTLKLSPEKQLKTECEDFLMWIREDLCTLSHSFPVPERTGAFCLSVLLSAPVFDREKFIRDFQRDWSVPVTPSDSPQLQFSIDSVTASVTLMPRPVPGQDAGKAAARNYLWPDSAKAVKSHKAHLLVTVLDSDTSLTECGMLLVKIAATCCLQPYITGIFTGPAVYQAGLYRKMASVIKDGRLPVFNWVWLGLYKTMHGIGGYTCGLELFGSREIEVSDTDVRPDQLRSFLADASSYILEEHTALEDGDTIAISPKECLPVTCSKGVALSGMTLKIPYGRSPSPAGPQKS